MTDAAEPGCDSRKLQVLLIEDSALDVELTQIMLERAGYEISYTVVDNEIAMRAALISQRFELILSDFLLPGFSGPAALEIARHHCPDVPFIFVSGVTGEETAVDMMRRGATDYILKQRLALLPQSVERAQTLVCERARRYRAESALAASQINVQLAVASGQFGMWDYRPLTGELIWDARCKEMFGLPADAHIDLDVFARGVHPDDRDRMQQVITDTTRSPGQSECNTDYRVLLPNGQVRWVNTCGKAFFDQGVCTHFVGLLMDVTERHAASAAMVRLNDVLEELVLIRTRERDRIWALSHDMLAVMRDDLTPVTLNPAWSDTLDVPHDTLLAGSIYRFIDDEDIPRTQEGLRGLAEGHAAVRFKTCMHGGNDKQCWLAWTVVRADGLLYCVVRDDTQERARLEELAASNQQLLSQIKQREQVEATLQKMQRLEAVGQLTAGVAHDFNNLLTVVLSNARFAERELRVFDVPDKTLQRLATISSAAQRGGKLTTQLLTFSRQQQLAPKAVNLNQMVDTMLELLRSTMGGSVRLTTELADNLWAALVDPTQIEMVILNLAINARDATDVGGTLLIATRNITIDTPLPGIGAPEAGEYVCLSVQDSGRGMSPAVLARAFEPFFTTKDVGKGSGLGLAQVYGFARQSHGGVSIDTQENVGTTVHVYLPRIAGATPEHLPEPVAPASPASTRADHPTTLLVVDDDDAVREANTQQLADFGYQVIAAESGAAALALLGDNPQIDALVADFAMPGMNGAELAGAVRQLRPALPVLFVTGYVELGRLDLPNSRIVQKPYSPEQLASSVSALLKAQPGPATPAR